MKKMRVTIRLKGDKYHRIHTVEIANAPCDFVVVNKVYGSKIRVLVGDTYTAKYETSFDGFPPILRTKK